VSVTDFLSFWIKDRDNRIPVCYVLSLRILWLNTTRIASDTIQRQHLLRPTGLLSGTVVFRKRCCSKPSACLWQCFCTAECKSFCKFGLLFGLTRTQRQRRWGLTPTCRRTNHKTSYCWKQSPSTKLAFVAMTHHY
jgi:hypothetical protein